MTNGFAIALLKQDIQNSKMNISYRHNEVGIEALELAIKALEQQEPSENCINRAEALKAIEKEKQGWEGTERYAIDECHSRIAELPSVTPKFTDAEIQKMQELEQAQLEKAYELGAEQTRWIPVSERLPEDLEPVNITWVNHNPESYYADIKDKPFTATGVYFNGQWYWWSTLCTDILAEYSHNYDDIIDDDIEITAWMPLPEPYKAESEEV